MHHPLSIVFCGTPEFAVPSLTALLNDPAFAVTLVVTQPDKPVGRTQTMTPPPVKVLAEQHGIPVLQPNNINDEATSYKLQATSCDYLVVVAYGQILSKEILALPRIAPVNVHPSLLPHWRGASPIQHAILSGDHKTGVTIQQMTAGLDAGPILGQESMPLGPETTNESLHRVSADMGAGLLVRTLKKPLSPVAQDEANVTTCAKLTRKSSQADPASMPAEEIDRKVRALTPWPGVTCPIKSETVKILRTSLTQLPESLPLPCAKNTTLFITELQPPGKKPMSGAAWARGRGQKP